MQATKASPRSATCAFKCNDDRQTCKADCKAQGKNLRARGLAFGACLLRGVVGGS